MKALGINLQLHYVPSYKFKVHKSINKKNQNLINSETYYENCFSFPIYYELKSSDVSDICNVIFKLITEYKKN